MAKRSLSLKLSVLGLAALLVLLQGRLWFSDEGWTEVVRLRSSVAEQQAEIERLRARNARLKAEVNDLKEGFAALEERARSDLGMVGPDESFYLFVPADNASDSSE
jgi:cell division protein FtsB